MGGNPGRGCPHGCVAVQQLVDDGQLRVLYYPVPFGRITIVSMNREATMRTHRWELYLLYHMPGHRYPNTLILRGRAAMCLSWVKRFVFLVAAALAAGCSSGTGALSVMPSSWQELPPPSSFSYLALNLPRGEMTLPAVFVGAQRQPSSGCFLDIQPSEPIPVAGELAATVKREKQFEADFKASFHTALIEAGLSAEAVSVLIERWETRLYGLKVVEVDPSLVRPNFANEACASVPLEWFTDDRAVAIGAILVDSLFVDMGSLANQDQRMKVAIAVQRVGTELGFSLARSALLDEALTYAATNVFVGVTTTGLAARRCMAGISGELTLDERTRFLACDGDIRVTLFRGADAYELELVVPYEGLSTGAFQVAGVFRKPLGAIRMTMGILEVDHPSDRAARVELIVNILEVGLSGSNLP